ASDTVLTLANTAGTWTMNPASYPFDLTVSGERVRAMAPGVMVEGYTFDTDVEGWTAPEGGTLARATDIVRRAPAALRLIPPATARMRLRIGSTPPATTLFYLAQPVVFDPSTVTARRPQRITVRRGINNISKPLAAGEPVRLHRPARIAL